MIRRPLPLLALAYAAGTACGLSIVLPPAMTGAPAAVLLVGAFLLSRTDVRRLKPLLLVPAVGLVAWTLCRRESEEPMPPAVLGEPGGSQPVVAVEGVVTQDPDYGRLLASGRVIRMFRLRADRLDTEFGTSYDWAGTIRVAWFSRGRDAAPAYGERWLLHGGLRLDTGPGGESARVLSTGRSQSERLSVGEGAGFVAGCLRGRRYAAARLERGIEDFPRAVGILRALILGYREQLDPATRELFAATGTLHLFAISGLHVGMVCGFIIVLLRACRVSRIYWVLLLGPLLAAYTVGTGGRPSAVRACLMALLYFAAPLVHRKPDPLSATAAAAMLILAWDPSQLREAGFVFSFTAVAGILALYPALDRVFGRIGRRDPFRIQEESSPVRLSRAAGRYLASLAAVSVAAWLSSAPLMAWYFGRIAPIGVLSNVVLIPPAALTVLSGCLSFTGGACLGLVAEIFNHAALALVTLLLAIVDVLQAVPFGRFEVERPPLVFVVAWYAVLALWMLRRQSPRAREFGF